VDESYHQALRTLLDSGDQAAVGIALDHWWTLTAPWSGVASKHANRRGHERIREVLRQPR
jgi:hypothetical protein